MSAMLTLFADAAGFGGGVDNLLTEDRFSILLEDGTSVILLE